jgi:hypothetical protein
VPISYLNNIYVICRADASRRTKTPGIETFAVSDPQEMRIHQVGFKEILYNKRRENDPMSSRLFETNK